MMNSSIVIFRSSAKRVLSVVRGTSVDISTAEGRASERWRRVALAAVSAVAAKALIMASLFASVSLTLRNLGQERFGLWMTISSVVTLFTFADLGIGSGLMNAVSHAHGRDDHEEAATLVSSAFCLLAGIALGALIIFGLIYPHVSWAAVFNAKSPLAVREAGPTAAVCIGCFVVTLPLSLVQRVQLGYQEGGQSNLWNCFGSILSVTLLYAAIKLRGGLPWLVLGFLGAPAIALLLNGCAFFGLQCPWLRPSWARVSRKALAGLWQVGVAFFVLQIVFQISTSLDNLIVAHVLGNAAVGKYAVCTRWFSIGIAIVSLVTTPLWPAYGEAWARGDMAWLKQTVWRTLRLAFGATVILCLLLVGLGKPVISRWAGPHMIPSYSLLIGMGLWMICESLRIVASTFLLAVKALRVQVAIMSVFGVFCISLQILLGRRYGLVGVVWAGTGTTLLLVTLPYLWYLRRWTSRMGSDSNA